MSLASRSLEERQQQVWDCVVAEGLTQSEIKERISGNQVLTIKAVHTLHKEGRLERTGGGKKGDPYRYFALLPTATRGETIDDGKSGATHRRRTNNESVESSRKPLGFLSQAAKRWASISNNQLRSIIGVGILAILGVIMIMLQFDSDHSPT